MKTFMKRRTFSSIWNSDHAWFTAIGGAKAGAIGLEQQRYWPRPRRAGRWRRPRARDAGGDKHLTRAFGKAQNHEQAMFFLGWISKPICVTALMTLFDRGALKLDDPLHKFIPKFTGEGRERVTMQHLLTHVSGLPDQLPENDSLRKRRFAACGLRRACDSDAVELHSPGWRLSVFPAWRFCWPRPFVEIISGVDILAFIERAVLQPLGMNTLSPGARAVCLSGYGADA